MVGASLDYTASVVPVISATIAASSLLLSYQRASKSDLDSIRKEAVALEHRLTVVEQNQFTDHDRRCLQEVDLKMGLLWNTVKEDFPSLLKQMTTTRFDLLLDKAHVGVQLMAPAEVDELLNLLDHDIQEAKETEHPNRAVIAAFYRAVIKYEAKRVDGNGCK